MATTAAVLDILVKAQTGKASAELRRLDRDLHKVDRTSRDTDRSMGALGNRSRALGGSISSANRNFRFMQNTMKLIKFPALIAGAGAAAQAFSALGAGAVGLTGALGPLTGSLVALPAAFGAAGQGAATALLAFSGLGDALGAMSDQQAKAGQTAVDTGQQQRAAAEAVRAAEEALGSSQRQVRFAQEDLTQARKDAVREMVDMRLAAKEAALGEEGAAISLARAQERLAEVRRDPASSALDEREALNAVKEAQLGVTSARLEAKRATEDLGKSERKGVQGSDQVTTARRALADAQRAATDSARQLTNAQLDAATAMASGGAAADLVAQKMAKLSPAARSFAKFLFSLKPQLDKLKQAAGQNLFPGLEKGLRSAMKNFPVVNRIIAETAKTMSHTAVQAGRLFGSKAFGQDLGRVGKGNARLLGAMGTASLSLASAMRHIMVAAQPLIKWMGRLAVGWAKNIDGAAKTGRETGRLAHFFRQTREVMQRLFSISGHLAGAFLQIGKAAAPLGRSILSAFDKASAGLENWTKSIGGQNQLKKYFHDARAPLFETGRLIRDVAKSFFSIGTSPGLTDFIHQLRVELLPVITNLIKTTTQSLGPALVKFGVEFAKLLSNFAGSGGALTAFVNTLTVFLKVFNALPGPVKSAIANLVVFGAIIKAMTFGSVITGITTMVSGIKWLSVTSKTAAGSTAFLRLQLLGLAVQEKVVAAMAAMRAAMASMIPTTIGLTFAIRALVAATVIGALITAAILIATHWRQTKQVLAKVWGFIKDNARWFALAVAVFMPFIGIPLLVATNWKKTKQVLGSVWGWIKNAAKDTFGAVVGFANDLVGKVSGAVKGGLNLVVGFINAIIGVLNKIPFVKIGKVGKIGGGGKAGHLPKGQPPSGPVGHQRGGIMVPGQGSGDKVPALLEPGEVVWNRKAVAVMGGAQKANSINRKIPRFALGGIGQAIGGAAKGAASLPGKALDLAGKGAGFFINKLPHPNLPGYLMPLGEGLLKGGVSYAKDKAASLFSGGPGGTGRGPKGIGTFEGMPMANWVIGALTYARRKGFSGHPTSGYRSHAYNVMQGRTYFSEHEGTQYPHGAVDFGGYNTGLATKMAAVAATASYKYPLLAPIGFHDDGHASGTGHRRGGIIQRLSGGGKVNWPATLNADQLRTLAHFAGMPNAGLMAQIAQAESMGNPNARGGAGEYGLWQIMPFWGGGASLLDPLKNARKAKYILGQQGLGAWSTYNDGAYRGYSQGRFSSAFAAMLRGKPAGGTAGKGGKGGGGGAPLPTTGIFAGKSAKQIRKMQAQIRRHQKHSKQVHQTKAHEHDVAQQWADLGVAVPYGGKVNFPEVEAGDDPAAEAAQALADAIQAQAEAMAELSAQLKQQNEFATAVTTVSLREAWRAMADVISGQIAGQLQPTGGAKPAGMAGVVRY